jgi:hypothetical protein
MRMLLHGSPVGNCSTRDNSDLLLQILRLRGNRQRFSNAARDDTPRHDG